MQVNDAMVAKAAESDAAFDGRTWLAMPKSERERYMERSRRSLTAALAEMWQGIETAPKDGSEFLGFGGGVEGDKGIQTVRWCERVGCWETPTASLEDWDNQAEGYSRPTHFMPLPTPPREK